MELGGQRCHVLFGCVACQAQHFRFPFVPVLRMVPPLYSSYPARYCPPLVLDQPSVDRKERMVRCTQFCIDRNLPLRHKAWTFSSDGKSLAFASDWSDMACSEYYEF